MKSSVNNRTSQEAQNKTEQNARTHDQKTNTNPGTNSKCVQIYYFHKRVENPAIFGPNHQKAMIWPLLPHHARKAGSDEVGAPQSKEARYRRDKIGKKSSFRFVLR